MSNQNQPRSNDLLKAMLAARTGICTTGSNPRAIRIPFRFWRPSGALQNGPQVAMSQTSPIYGNGGIGGGAESSGAVWCPGLEHKTITILAQPGELTTHNVLIQTNVVGSDLLGEDWITISDPIVRPGIFAVAVPVPFATPFYLEPETTLLRVIGYFNDVANQDGTLPPSISAVLSASWEGPGKWPMRCTDNYEGV